MSAEPTTSGVARHEIEPRLRELFAQGEGREVSSAYLFGSHAAGREHRESDVVERRRPRAGERPLSLDRPAGSR